jgi:putative DNA primase/helicase
MKSGRYDDSNPNYPNDAWDSVEKRWLRKEDLPKKARPNGEAKDDSGQPILLSPETFEMETIQWLWKHWLAKGKFHILAGAPEAGKTTLGLSFAASISSGDYWPDGTRASAENVLIWTSEDDIADTIKPRLAQMNADLTRIKVVAKQRFRDGLERPFNPATDMPSLTEAAKSIQGGVGFLMIDPIVAAIGTKTDSHRNAETRCALQPVIDFAEATNCAVLGITHLTKGTAGKDPTERVTGSLAFGAVARIVMLAAKKQNDDENAPPRIFTRAKSNIGPSGGGFGYDIVASPLYERPDIIATRIAWHDQLEGTARELLDEAEAQEDKQTSLSKTELAGRFLKAALTKGERPQTEIEAEAKSEGISSRTLSRASVGLVQKRKDGKTGAWFWSL